jgi:transposase
MPKIARRGVPHGSGLGKPRWIVERTFARFHRFKRFRTRYEIRADRHLGLDASSPAFPRAPALWTSWSAAPATHVRCRSIWVFAESFLFRSSE